MFWNLPKFDEDCKSSPIHKKGGKQNFQLYANFNFASFYKILEILTYI
jgi:hypothetical protein